MSNYEGLARTLKSLSNHALERNDKAALFICADRRLSSPLVHGTMEEFGVVHAYLEVPTSFDVNNFANFHIGPFDWLFIDRGALGGQISAEAWRVAFDAKAVVPYDEQQTWANALMATLPIIGIHASRDRVALLGEGPFGDVVAKMLGPFRTRVGSFEELDDASSDHVASMVVIATGPMSDETELALMRNRNIKLVVDAAMGSISPPTVAKLLDSGVVVLRVDNRPARSGLVKLMIETAALHEQVRGSLTIEGVEVVAGGEMGRAGAVIVDSISHPREIVGIADGGGRTLRHLEDADTRKKIAIVTRYLTQ